MDSLQKFNAAATNFTAAIEGNKLVLTVNLDEQHGITPKGFDRIASTHGNKVITVNGREYRCGLNIYA